jgi:hypothetical protein
MSMSIYLDFHMSMSISTYDTYIHGDEDIYKYMYNGVEIDRQLHSYIRCYTVTHTTQIDTDRHIT